MSIREWELSVQDTGATRVRVSSIKQREYTAEATVANEPVVVTGETMDAVRGKLLERCRAVRRENESDDDIPF